MKLGVLKKMQRIKYILLRKVFFYIERKTNHRWNNYPLGSAPKASKEVYLNLAEKMRQKVYAEIDNCEKQFGFSINPIWLHDLALHTQIVVKESELCYQHGRVLYASLSRYLNDQKSQCDKKSRITILETGTARGFSSLCMAKALSDNSYEGVIVTFDVLPQDTKMYWNCVDDHEGPKSRAELLYPWRELLERYIIFHQGDTKIELPKVKASRINFAFLDGAHTYEDVWFEFDQLKDRQQPGDIIVYDDYTKSQFPGLVRAVDEICEAYAYTRSHFSANDNRGYVVAEKK